jgi:uncharacterized protein YegP (UPF0339 family)
MTARNPRFEIVRTAAGWHARFRAANGRVVWVTEVYERRRAAVRAVEAIAGSAVIGTTVIGTTYLTVNWSRGHLRVVEVDERREAAAKRAGR